MTGPLSTGHRLTRSTTRRPASGARATGTGQADAPSPEELAPAPRRTTGKLHYRSSQSRPRSGSDDAELVALGIGHDHAVERAKGFAALLAAAGAHPETEGEVQLTWTATGEDALLRGVLLGEPAAALTRARAPVLAAAAPFRRTQGYVLTNHFRYAVARPT